MSLSTGLNVIFGEDDISDYLFKACAEFASTNAYTHWMRRFPLQRLPEVPEELTDNPIRLKHIVFYYDDPLQLRKAASFAMDIRCRQRGDLIIIEQPSISHAHCLATIFAILENYGRLGNTAIISLPNSVDFQLTASLYTTRLLEINPDGHLRSLLEPLPLRIQ